MDALSGLLNALAIVAIVGAGLATIAGADALRGRLLGAAVVLVVVALAVPAIVAAMGSMVSAPAGTALDEPEIPRSGAPEAVPVWFIVAFVVGHGALGAALLRRARRRAGHGRDNAQEIAAARGRLRPRFSADGQEGPH